MPAFLPSEGRRDRTCVFALELGLRSDRLADRAVNIGTVVVRHLTSAPTSDDVACGLEGTVLRASVVFLTARTTIAMTMVASTGSGFVYVGSALL